MVMKPEEILQRLEEIEDYMETAKRLGSPPTGWHDTAWLCQVVRELLARSERLEAVAEAARELVNKPAYRPRLQDRDRWYAAWGRLREALAALEERRG